MSKVFTPPGVVEMTDDGALFIPLPPTPISNTNTVLCVRLCASQLVHIVVDARTGRINLRDTGDLGTAGRSHRFTPFAERLNENAAVLLDVLMHIRVLVCTLHL